MFAPAARTRVDESDEILNDTSEALGGHPRPRSRHPGVVPPRRRRRRQRRGRRPDDDQAVDQGGGRRQPRARDRRAGGGDARERAHPRTAGAAHPQPCGHGARFRARRGADRGGRPREGRDPGGAVGLCHARCGGGVPRAEPVRWRPAEHGAGSGRGHRGHGGDARRPPDAARTGTRPRRPGPAATARHHLARGLGALQERPRPRRDRDPPRGGSRRGRAPRGRAPARDDQSAADTAQRRWVAVRPVPLRVERLQDHPLGARGPLRAWRPARGR